MSQFIPANNYKPSDEIDLVELLQGLWKQKLLITLFTCVVAAGAAIYAFLATPQYEVQSLLRLTSINDLDELNSTGVYKLEPSEALKQVGASLDSYATRIAFFTENTQLIEPLHKPNRSLQQDVDVLNDGGGFKVLQPDPKKSDNLAAFVGIQLRYSSSVDGVKIVNGLVESAIEQERVRIAADLRGVVSSRVRELERKIKTARAGYETEKLSKIAQLSEADTLKRAQLQDELKALRQELKTLRGQRVTQLEEAAQIAKALSIIKPSTRSSLGEEERVSTVNGNIIRTEVSNQQLPLYFMGTEALEAERSALLQRRSDDFTQPRVAEIQKQLQLLENNRQIEVLKKRENQDLFLSDLAKLHREGARLKSINLDLSTLQLVRIDQKAEPPTKPIAPKKTLIIGLGIILGGLLGVFVALIRSMLINRKTRVEVV
ncbi:MAG: Wzz/FepE/Etk N-terminal domain-containing protein [Pseudomonas sp.]|uniref:Wzz/FepE/Etk N-terminal domain-containing protein n=1 Tax=Pseudomonas sp. TaxID=306 RepID=UPI0027362C06|nr:Wzz/FepE/Etk N-terminal domain-containing protein [Pseudomonas sp.]MDP3846169.1 Wzz/FepE/Etk N-terminal domain-containing protein [Pseudomonas sp.]